MTGQPGFFDVDEQYAALFVRTIGMANLVYNITRLAWLSTRAAPG
jgi:hypothetical protein